MAKKIEAYIKLQVPAGQANPSPPVGPALGQHGVQIMEFCKAFNAQTQSLEQGLPIPVVITVYSDRSFTFITKTPPASVLLRKVMGLDKGSSTPNTVKVGTATREQLEEVAKQKMPDLNTDDMDPNTADYPLARNMSKKMTEVLEDQRRENKLREIILNNKVRTLVHEFANKIQRNNKLLPPPNFTAFKKAKAEKYEDGSLLNGIPEWPWLGTILNLSIAAGLWDCLTHRFVAPFAALSLSLV